MTKLTKYALAIPAAGAALSTLAKADEAAVVTAVTGQLTGMGTNAVTIGVGFLAVVGIIAIITLGAKFLRKH